MRCLKNRTLPLSSTMLHLWRKLVCEEQGDISFEMCLVTHDFP
jgi:hypothetical protein